MKRAAVFLLSALFILLVIQPNLHNRPAEPSARIPAYSETAKTNEDLQQEMCASKSVIVIDPGRGGADTGYDPEGHLAEKDVAMQLALNVGDALATAGYEVYYTRWFDDISTFRSQKESDMYRLEVARSYDADYILALRFTSGSSLEKGFSIFHQPDVDRLNALSRELAANIQATNYTQFLGVDDDHYSNFPILSSKDIPAVLMQMGFLSNSEDYAKITDSGFQIRLASAIARAFLDTIN